MAQTYTKEKIDELLGDVLPEQASGDEGKYLKVGESGLEWAEAGTEVIANPTLVGTESALSGLQVGDTKYKIAGGTNFAGDETGSLSTASHGATASGVYAVAIGESARATGMQGVAIGGNNPDYPNAATSANTGVAIGYAGTTDYGIAIGSRNRSTANSGIAIGNGANARNNSVAIGFNSSASGDYSINIGTKLDGNISLDIPRSVCLSGLAFVRLSKMTSSYTIPTGYNAIILETTGTITTKTAGDVIATGGTGLMIMW